jgi:hypothetical protein
MLEYSGVFWGTGAQRFIFRVQLLGFCCFQEGCLLNSRARGVLGIFHNLGVPEATVATVLMFSKVLETIGDQLDLDHPRSVGSSKASSKVLDIFDSSIRPFMGASSYVPWRRLDGRKGRRDARRGGTTNNGRNEGR